MYSTEGRNNGFLKTVYSSIGADMAVLDLGAGDGRIARRMAELGADVTAVELHQPSEPVEGATWVVSDVQEYVQRLSKDKYFDLVLLRNIIQFLPFTEVVEDFFPQILRHLTRSGRMAIATFYRAPEPPFDRPFASLYTLNDLRHALPGWVEVYADEHRQLGPDLQGNERRFFYTELIIQRPEKVR